MSIVTRPRRKAHCVFGYTFEGLKVMYCGLRWDDRAQWATRKRKHCKHCTRELRKAGMSWRWFMEQDELKGNP